MPTRNNNSGQYMAPLEIIPEGTETESNDHHDDVKLQKSLGLHNGVAMIVGVIVGSGIFITPKGVLDHVGSPLVAMLIWGLCGLISTMGAYCYCELGTMIKESGGDYAYVKNTFGGKTFARVISFCCLWAYVIIIYPAGNAILAMTFAQYALKPIFLGCIDIIIPNYLTQILAALLTTLLTALNCWNVSWANNIQVTFTITKVIALIIIIIVGIVELSSASNLLEHASLSSFTEGTSKDPADWALGFYQGIFAYSGWNALNFLTEELREPEKNLKKSVWISLPVVTVIYLLTNFAYFAVLTVDQIKADSAVAVIFGEITMPQVPFLTPVFVAISTVGALNGCIVISSRLFYVGARDHLMPNMLSFISYKYMTPIPALIVQCILTCVYLFVGDNVHNLVKYTSFSELFFITLSVLGLIVMRHTHPNADRPVRIHIWVAWIFLAFMVFFLVAPILSNPRELLYGILLMLAACPVYVTFIFLAKQNKSFGDSLHDMMIRITHVSQRLLLTTPEGTFSKLSPNAATPRQPQEDEDSLAAQELSGDEQDTTC